MTGMHVPACSTQAVHNVEFKSNNRSSDTDVMLCLSDDSVHA